MELSHMQLAHYPRTRPGDTYHLPVTPRLQFPTSLGGRSFSSDIPCRKQNGL